MYGPDLASIEKAGLQLEQALKHIDNINHASVFYDRTEGAPYVEIKLNREKLARYGIKVQNMQDILMTAIGGMSEGTTVEGRERFNIRVRYARELRDKPESLGNVLISASDGTQIPLSQLADIEFKKGATMISSENTFLLGYITFDKKDNVAEVDVVNNAKKTLDDLVAKGKIVLPKGVTYQFTGNIRTRGSCHTTFGVGNTYYALNYLAHTLFSVPFCHRISHSFLGSVCGFCRRIHSHWTLFAALVHGFYYRWTEYAHAFRYPHH